MFQQLANFSQLPIVNLTDISLPKDGLSYELSEACRKNYSKNDACKEHYRRMAGIEGEGMVQCPYGFASLKLKTGQLGVALTGFVPYPRLGGKKEQIIARRHPELRVTAEAVERVVESLKEVHRRHQEFESAMLRRQATLESDGRARLRRMEEETAQNYSMALHEIRKLNRTVLQTAEQLCISQRPQAPDLADAPLVTIWKTSELMSKQFDVIEILANGVLNTLAVNIPSVIYQLVDKCVKVYQVQAEHGKRIFLQAPPQYRPKVLVCKRTFSIIPTVLISNALKYSKPNTEVRVMLGGQDEVCELSVMSVAEGDEILNEDIFRRGVRRSQDKEGSGVGLYVAQLVAEQHNTRISVQSTVISPGIVRHVFKVPFRVLR